MDDDLLSDPSEYKIMVGALKYLTMKRPYIAYVVNVVCHYMHAPRTTHLHCVKCIFRYLQGTLTYSLSLCACSTTSMVMSYSDADWGGCLDSRRLTTTFAIFLGPNIISWCAKKQPTMSNLLQRLSKGLLHTPFQRLVGFITFFKSFVPLFVALFVSCVTMSVLHDRSKHIDVDFHFVCDKVAQGDIVVQYIPTLLQFVDIFTKGLSSSRFCFLRDNLSFTIACPD
uniref:Reverse transcriptase Ty1/copia-type domain-containing protein n=1 Tax=Solanum lycopersicum TaxID=4081 RepID=A0A3Q7FKR5_SOLLC